MTTSIGDKIIAAVISGGLFEAHDADARPIEQPLLYIWSSGAAEQLEAIVEAHIEERVRVRLELDKEKIFREGYSAGYKHGEDDTSRWECGGGSTHPKTRKSCEDSAWQDFNTA